MIRRILGAAILAVLALATVPDAQAQAYPVKPIRFVLPLPPGSVTDGMARLVGQRLQEAWGQPVISENRPGANQFIASELVAKSPADGYTLLLGNHATHAMNSGLFRKLPYDPLKDFMPVSLLVTSTNLLMAKLSLPANNVRELVELARAKPGALNYGSQGTGSSGHIGGYLFAQMANINLVHVPYKGPAQATADLLAGQIDLFLDTVFSQLGNSRNGKLKVLGVSSPQRSPLLPDVPTVAEQGVAGFEVIPWFGLFAPTGTPRDVVGKLSGEIQKILAAPELRDRLTQQGLTVVASSPEEFAQHVAGENAKWTKIIREANIQPD